VTEELRFDLPGGAWMRLWREEDAEEVFGLLDRNRERLREWLPWVDDIERSKDELAFIRSSSEKGEAEMDFGIFVGERAAGGIGLHVDRPQLSAMIGYWLDAEHEGKGLVTLATEALTRYAFEELGLHRVWISVDEDNASSRAVPERLGFVREAILRDDSYLAGRFRDKVIYGMLEDEWRARSS
jgi:ribosomal-protein-serine acetyltransferase